MNYTAPLSPVINRTNVMLMLIENLLTNEQSINKGRLTESEYEKNVYYTITMLEGVLCRYDLQEYKGKPYFTDKQLIYFFDMFLTSYLKNYTNITGLSFNNHSMLFFQTEDNKIIDLHKKEKDFEGFKNSAPSYYSLDSTNKLLMADGMLPTPNKVFYKEQPKNVLELQLEYTTLYNKLFIKNPTLEGTDVSNIM